MDAYPLCDLVLLHLAAAEERAEGPPASRSRTADGIGDALELSDDVVARIDLIGRLDSLVEAGLIEATEQRVDGATQPRTVYALTAAGETRARDARADLASETVVVTDDADGERSDEVALSEVGQYVDGGTDPVVTAAVRMTDDGEVPVSREPVDRLVGRESALATVSSAIEASAYRGSQTVVVRGEAGTGKTALVREATERAREELPEVVLARGGTAAAGDDTYAPVRQAFDAIPGGDGLLDALAAASDAVTPETPERVRAQRTALFTDVADALRAVATDRPVVLFLDNLQWADEATLDLFAHLATTVTEWLYPVAFVGCYRDGAPTDDADHPLHHVLERLDAATEVVDVRLDPLSRRGTRRLLAARLQTASLPAAFVDRVHERTGGNPLFVDETASHLLETGAVDPDGDGVPTSPGSLPLPAAIGDGVDRRLATLDEPSRDLLRLAAVVGEYVPGAVLAEASDLPPARRQEYLDALVASGILERVGQEDDPARREAPAVGHPDERADLVFVGGALREAVLAGVPDGDASRYHEQVAEALTAVHDETDDEWAARTAHHFEEAGQLGRAIDHYRRAGDHATASYANEDALENYRRALSLGAVHDGTAPDDLATIVRKVAKVHQTLGELDETVETVEQGLALAREQSRERCELLDLLGTVQMTRGDLDAATETFRRERDLATTVEARDLEGRAIRELGVVATRRGDLETARGQFEHGLAISREVGHEVGEAASLGNLGLVAYQEGDLEAARSYHERSLERYRDRDDRAGQARSLGNLGATASKAGSIEDAREYYEQSRALFQEVGDRAGEARVLGNLANVTSRQGDYQAARELYERSIETKRSVGDLAGRARGRKNLADALLAQGEVEAARQRFERSLDLFREADDRAGVGQCHNGLGRVARSTGALDRAVEHHEQALELLRAVGDRQNEANTMRNLGRVARARGALDSARQRLEQSLDVFREVGDRHSEATVLGQLGAVAADRGDRERACEHHERSLELAAELGYPHQTALSRGRLGAARLAQGEVEAGRDAIESAVSTLGDIGAVPDELRVRLRHAEAEQEQGNETRAREICERARERVDEAGAASLRQREQIEALSQRLDG